MSDSLQEQFGRIDIYVFDQILRGSIAPGMRIVDAGCGHGRNLVYLLGAGAEIFAVDADPDSVGYVRQMSQTMGTGLPDGNFQVADLEKLPYASEFADVVICNSVLHFARDRAHFLAMVEELWRVVRPGGMLFCRLGSQIGMAFRAVGNGFFAMPDGQTWYLVDEAELLGLTAKMKGMLVDPLKTTIVQAERCMTTWVLRKLR